MTEAETKMMIQAAVREELKQLRIQGDNEVGVHGSWPSFALHSKRAAQQTIFTPPGGGTDAPLHPFSLAFRKHSGAWQVSVWIYSPVQQSEDHTDLVYADNVGDDINPQKSSDGKWLAIADGDELWGKITFDPSNDDAPFTITAHTLQTTTSAGAGFPSGGEAEYTNVGTEEDPRLQQSKLRYPIAKFGIPDGGRPIATITYACSVIRLVDDNFTATLSDGTTPTDIFGKFYVQ